MSYKIIIHNPHEINRDLATILGNAAKTDWTLTAYDLSAWINIQKQVYPSWNDLSSADYGDTFSIYQHEFAEQKREICTIILYI